MNMKRFIAILSIITSAPSQAPSYTRQIRPILAKNCFSCHGPDDRQRKAKLRLDQPGAPQTEQLLRRITSHDPDEVMPPPDSGKALTNSQIALLRRWVTAGAAYEKHWSFVAPRRTALPSTRASVAHPIDRFVRARLEREGLEPSPRADRLTLVRRVYLDLIGLPPTPAAADAFVANHSADAYEQLVDRLLASPHYGERWARRWLDLARYADSNGYEKDRDRSIWPYRDWVIRSLNRDQPFDQFTIEQIAGDMLPDPTPDQLIATGFHRNTMLNEDGGIDPLEYRFHAMTDRVSTTGTAFLGLTTGCAQCHTHKFDPVTHRDYYGMMALLNSADEPDYVLADAARSRAHRRRLARADQLVANLADQWPTTAEPLETRFANWLEEARRMTPRWVTLQPSRVRTNLPLLTLEGKPLPASIIGDQRYAFIRRDAAVLGPRFKFQRHGEAGAVLGQTLPEVADELCIVRSMHTDQFNHAPAQLLLSTGFSQPGRPCLGSWTLYGRGATTTDLPAFVIMSTGSGLSGGAALWSSGFMPTVYTGVRLRAGRDPILNVSTPAGFSDAMQSDTFSLIAKLNRQRLTTVGDPEIETRIAAFDMAARLQRSAPELLDLRSEGQTTLDLYGCEPSKPSFARACLLARRMIERGVRFVNIFHEGWDAHTDVRGNTLRNCGATDRASAALVADLRQRGLLDDTLVIWGGEFGRTPMVETNPALGRKLGRDHHPQAFTVWLAGGGSRAGHTHGRTDEFGFHIVEDPVHVYDLQATILHLLGFDHERLTYSASGRDYRLTDVHGKVIRGLLA